jgi:Recombination endonuclease VII
VTKHKRKSVKRNYVQRTCQECGELYTPISGSQIWCKICVPHDKAKRLMYRYGLSWPRYLLAIAEPCPLCGDAATVVDHNHATGKYRGVLCSACNSALGRLEIAGWKERANEYLSKGVKIND